MKKKEAESLAKSLVKAWLIEDCHEKPHIAETMSRCMKLVTRIYEEFIKLEKASNENTSRLP